MLDSTHEAEDLSLRLYNWHRRAVPITDIYYEKPKNIENREVFDIRIYQ